MLVANSLLALNIGASAEWADELSGPGVQALRPPPAVPAPAPTPAPAQVLAPPPEQSESVSAPAQSTPKKLLPREAVPPTPVSRSRPQDPRASAHRAALIKAALEKDEKGTRALIPPVLENAADNPDSAKNEAEIRDVMHKADEPVSKRFKFVKQETPGSAYISPKRTPAPSFSGNDLDDDDKDSEVRKVESPKRKRIDMDDAEYNPFFVRSPPTAQPMPDLTAAGARLKGLERQLADSQRTNVDHEEKIRNLENRILSLEIHNRNLDATVLTLTQLLS